MEVKGILQKKGPRAPGWVRVTESMPFAQETESNTVTGEGQGTEIEWLAAVRSQCFVGLIKEFRLFTPTLVGGKPLSKTFRGRWKVEGGLCRVRERIE